MYSSFQLAKKYLRYYLGAYNSKGHGVHSPFVFDFITHVLNDRKAYPCYANIEATRKKLMQDGSLIRVMDHGAGSAVIQGEERKVSAIAASSLKPGKYAQLLHRMVRYYKPENILELGTSFGTTTLYLAYGNNNAKVYTLEGAPSIARMANQNFSEHGLQHIHLEEGEFSATLPLVLSKTGQLDFVYIDGNHQHQPTMEYFRMLLPKLHDKSILVFDDIHWSEGMERAWTEICADPAVTLSIDLFFVGIVFFDKAFLVKQHFPIRF